MTLKSLIFCSVFLSILGNLNAQVSLTLEKRGAKEILSYEMGDEIEYLLEGDPLWSAGIITGLHFESGTIYFENGHIRIKNIHSIRIRKGSSSRKKLGNKVMLFGAQWAVFSSLGRFAGYKAGFKDLVVSSASIITGFLLGHTFQSRVIKLKGTKNLRIRDLRWMNALDGA